MKVKDLVDLMDNTSRFWDNLAVKNKDIQKILDNYVYPLAVNFGWDFAWGNDGLPEVKFYKNGEEQKYVSADYVIKELKKALLEYEAAIKNTQNSIKYSASKLIKRYELLEQCIFDTKKAVWSEYARFLKELAWWCLIKNLYCRLDLTQEQNQLLDKLSKIYANYDANLYKLDYESQKKYRLNNKRVNMIKLITRAKSVLSEFEKTLINISSIDELLSELDNKNRSLNIHELSELAKSLLEKNQKNEIFIDNDINFEYLLKNNLFYCLPADTKARNILIKRRKNEKNTMF